MVLCSIGYDKIIIDNFLLRNFHLENKRQGNSEWLFDMKKADGGRK